MFICPNCNFTSETPCNFCMKCGSPMVEKVITPEVPVYNPPVVETPTVEEPVFEEPVFPSPVLNSEQHLPNVGYQPFQAQSPSYLGKSIAGMVLSIMGLFFALYFSLIIFSEGIEDGSILLGLSFILSFFSFPLSLVGLILSSTAASRGATNKMCRIGKILGIIGIAFVGTIAALGFFMSFAEFAY